MGEGCSREVETNTGTQFSKQAIPLPTRLPSGCPLDGTSKNVQKGCAPAVAVAQGLGSLAEVLTFRESARDLLRKKKNKRKMRRLTSCCNRSI